MSENHKQFFRMMKEIKTYLTPRIPVSPKIRIGEKWDGSYVVSDIKPDVCFSYGSNDDIKFEVGLFDTYNTPSLVFDHTIEGITNKPEYITFFKEGLFNAHDLKRQTSSYDGTNALLKMDIEGSEWGVFSQEPDLSKFQHIVCELHFFIGAYKWYDAIPKSLAHITNTHVPIHVHGTKWPVNPWIDLNFPKVLEVTFLRKGDATDEIDMGPYPNELDWDFDDPLRFPVCSWWKTGTHRLE